MYARIPARVMFFFVWVGVCSPAFSQIRINEWSTANLSTLRAEDGEFYDWIEIYNGYDTSMDLAGYGLSDNPSQPFKWIFPSATLPGKSYAVVFASGLDQRTFDFVRHTLITEGDEWSYFPGTQNPPSNWRDLDFDAQNWDQGPSGFGQLDGDDATVVTTSVIYIRKEFDIPAEFLDQVSSLYLHVDYDDAYVAWLNEWEIDRQNIGVPGIAPSVGERAHSSTEARLYRNWKLNHRRISDFQSTLRAGKNVLCLQVHNDSVASQDVTLIPFLTVGLSKGRPGYVHPSLNLPEHSLHSNFKLKSEGEAIVLTSPNGNVVDQVLTQPTLPDYSQGLALDQGSLLVFREPTPGTSNATEGRVGIAEPVQVSAGSGWVNGNEKVELWHPNPTASIRYSFNSKDPSESNRLYSGPFALRDTIQIMRTRAFVDGYWPSPIVSRTYFKTYHKHQIPVISLVTDPANLWNQQTGIYINWTSKEERPAHWEYFDENLHLQYAADIGIVIHGASSAGFAQKPFRLLARSEYGTSAFEFPFFGDEDDYFKRLVLRNSGNDWCFTQMRDGLACALGIRMGLEAARFQPALLFLNGNYWGTINIRDRWDHWLLSNKYGIEPTQIDLLEFDQVAKQGDPYHFRSMMNYIYSSDMQNTETLRHIDTLMDLENYMDYYILQTFIDNTDWPQNNFRYWRPRLPGGRWRWLLYDTDFSLGRIYPASNKSIDRIVNQTGLLEFSVEPLRTLLENTEFKNRFINRYADYLNSILHPESVLAEFEQMRASIEPSMNDHFRRWEYVLGRWRTQLVYLEDFLRERRDYSFEDLKGTFQLQGLFNLQLDVYPTQSGIVELDAIQIDEHWEGQYFVDVPIRLHAIPKTGYAFASWSDSRLPQEPVITLQPGMSYSVTAEFVPVDIVINEINYNSAPQFDPEDWVELHNNTSVAVDLSDWEFRDESDSHRFRIPQGTVIPARGFLVLAENAATFSNLYPGISPVVGNLNFGFSGSGELLRLFDPDGALHDHVLYDDQAPWPSGPDGNGPTLELIEPNTDNNLGPSWAGSVPLYGTPGAENSVTP